MLAGRERLGPTSSWTPIYDALADDLARDLATGWLPSYGPDERWPCDHAPALSTLRLHAKLRRSDRSAHAATELADRFRAALATSTGFPTSVGRSGDPTQRGTALAFVAGFTLPGDPEVASTFAARLITICDRTPVAACREWPRGIDHPADSASGPLLQGYSVGATALALAATRALADTEWNAALLRTARTAGSDRLDPRTQTLESAYLRWGETARSWLP